MRNGRLHHYEFPPMSSYHRLLLHRLAQRFALAHTAVDMPTYNQYGQFTGECCKIVVTKAEQSSIPRFLLVHIAQLRNENRNGGKPKKKVLMMKRRDKGSKYGQNRNGRAGGAGTKNSAQKSIEERERAYAQARAKIFGDDNSSAGDAGAGDSCDKPASAPTTVNTSNTSKPTKASNPKSNSLATSKSTASSAHGFHPIRESERAEYARGPDRRTLGFYGAGRGRGRGLNPGAPMYSQRAPHPPRGHSPHQYGYDRGYGPRTHDHHHNSRSPPNNSPDYRRDMYRPMSAPDQSHYYHGQPMSQMVPAAAMGYVPSGPRGPVHMQTSPMHRDQPRNEAYDRNYHMYRPPAYYPPRDNQNFSTLR